MPQEGLRAQREATGLSLRELCRRSGWVEDGESQPGHINPGRLSLIERGLTATPEEEATLMRLLDEAAGTPATAESAA